MTNQAAQTMPTLPRPYWKAGDVKDDYGNPYNETDLFTDDDMRAMYQQGYAAALSQPAGVADMDAFMAKWEWLILSRCRDEFRADLAAMLAAAPAASGVDTSTNEAWAARAQEKIAAMEAATGGEACACIYYGLGKAAPYLCEMHKARKADPHPPPAASVSERARDDRFTAMLIGIIADVQDALGFTDEDKECSNGSLEIVAAIRELKEQALTQQRGAPVFDRAWVVRDAELRAAAYNLLNLVEGVGCERWQNANGFRLKDTQQWVEFYIATKNVQSFGEVTTPQPSADAVRELVLLSRGLAKRTFNRSTAEMYIHFADELESLISGGSHA